jgi:hypothetical protein
MAKKKVSSAAPPTNGAVRSAVANRYGIGIDSPAAGTSFSAGGLQVQGFVLAPESAVRAVFLQRVYCHPENGLHDPIPGQPNIFADLTDNGSSTNNWQAAFSYVPPGVYQLVAVGKKSMASISLLHVQTPPTAGMRMVAIGTPASGDHVAASGFTTNGTFSSPPDLSCTAVYLQALDDNGQPTGDPIYATVQNTGSTGMLGQSGWTATFDAVSNPNPNGYALFAAGTFTHTSVSPIYLDS